MTDLYSRCSTGLSCHSLLVYLETYTCISMILYNGRPLMSSTATAKDPGGQPGRFTRLGLGKRVFEPEWAKKCTPKQKKQRFPARSQRHPKTAQTRIEQLRAASSSFEHRAASRGLECPFRASPRERDWRSSKGPGAGWGFEQLRAESSSIEQHRAASRSIEGPPRATKGLEWAEPGLNSLEKPKIGVNGLIFGIWCRRVPQHAAGRRRVAEGPVHTKSQVHAGNKNPGTPVLSIIPLSVVISLRSKIGFQEQYHIILVQSSSPPCDS